MAIVFSEDFTGGSVGAAVTTANTTFTNVSGLGTATFITDPFDATRRMAEFVTSANFKIYEFEPPSSVLQWIRFDMDMVTTTATATPLIQSYDSITATNKILDLRQSAGARTLQLRNVSTSVWVSNALAASTKYRVYVYMKVDATKRIRCMIYDGANLDNLFQDSGEIVSTTVGTTIGQHWLGLQTSSTGTTRIGRVRVDDATQPFDASTGTVWTRGLEVRIG